MTVSQIKPLAAEASSAANAYRSSAAGEDYAAVAAKVAPGEADAKVASARAPRNAATQGVSADGLAAMRLALARMGAASTDVPAATAVTSTPPATPAKSDVVDVGAQPAGSSAGSAARLPPLAGGDLQDMLKLQTGSFNPALYERLGARYNDYVNAYGVGGYYYDPAAITLAAMSDGEFEKLKTQYASPRAWLEKQGWYANAVAAAPASWDDVQRARLA